MKSQPRFLLILIFYVTQCKIFTQWFRVQLTVALVTMHDSVIWTFFLKAFWFYW